MGTKFLKFNLKNRCFLNNTVFFTVLLYVIYSFTFILPHKLHCVIYNNEQNVCQQFHTNSFNNDELSNSEQNSENEKEEKEDYDLDDCPICNLSYFNSFNYSKPLIFDFALHITNEKLVYQTTNSFYSCSYFKFFLRSPPSYIS